MNGNDDFRENYSAYMESAQWQELRRQRLLIDSGKCQMCGEPATDVHHLNYKQPLGEEDPYVDLVCLCGACHRKLHNMMNRKTSPSGRRGWYSSSIPLHIKMNLHERNLM